MDGVIIVAGCVEIATFFFSALAVPKLDGDEPCEEREDIADCNLGLTGDAGLRGDGVDGWKVSVVGDRLEEEV